MNLVGALILVGAVGAIALLWNPTICSPLENAIGRAVPFCGENNRGSSNNPLDTLFGVHSPQHQQMARNAARASLRHQSGVPVSIHSADKRHAFDKAHPGGPTVPAFNVDPMSIGSHFAYSMLGVTHDSISI